MICISIGKIPFQECLNTINRFECAEIRLDLAGFTPRQISRIFSQPVKLIATCRAGNLPNEARFHLLKNAIESGAAFLDLELEAPEEYKSELIDFARTGGCEIIISYHNFRQTPPLSQLQQKIAECLNSGAEIVKIACQVNTPADSARILSLYDSELGSKGKIIAIGMGKLGKITRVAAPMLGAPLTFASISQENQTADGQVQHNRLASLLDGLKHV